MLLSSLLIKFHIAKSTIIRQEQKWEIKNGIIILYGWLYNNLSEKINNTLQKQYIIVRFLLQ